MPLKMFVWNDVLRDYTSGMVCVLAHDLAEAHLLIAGESFYESIPQQPSEIHESPAVAWVYGGG